MYDVNDYGRMMADPVRMNAYTEALRRAVKPGSVVVDVGTGTGIFALLAAKFGARKVYAIDTNPCIALARDVAKRNGYAQTIEFIQGSVFDLTLPERADVMIGDCRGAFTLHGRHPELFFVARDKFLREDGAVIPALDELLVSAIACGDAYDLLANRWSVGGFDWQPCRDVALSSVLDGREVDLSKSVTIVAAAPWAMVDFRRATDATAHGVARGVARTAGSVHFLALSFRSQVLGDLAYARDDVRGTYAPLLLPLQEPLAVAKDEPITIDLDAFPTADDYVFAWRLRTRNAERRQVTDGNPKRSLPLEFGRGKGHPTA